MQCWKILELPSNSDIKSIKKRYAQKLKTTKPDEDPEGFQRLHSAYQEAINITKKAQAHKQPEPEPSPVNDAPFVMDANLTFNEKNLFEGTESLTIDNPETEKSTYDTWDNQASQMSHDEVCKDTVLMTRLQTFNQKTAAKSESTEIPPSTSDQLLKQALALLQSPNTINNKSQWQDILSQCLYLDLGENDNFSRQLFEAVVSHIKNKTSPVFTTNTLRYLNKVLAWHYLIERFEQDLHDSDIETFGHALLTTKERLRYKYLSPVLHQGTIVFSDRFIRFFAFGIDLSLLFILVLIGQSINDLVPETWAITFNQGALLMLFWLFLAFPLMESTPIQGSFGKLIFGIKVVDRQGKRLTIFHAIWRLIILLLVIITSKFSLWINIFLNNNVLLQDIASFSRVINRH